MKKIVVLLMLLLFSFSSLAATCTIAASAPNSNVTADFTVTSTSGAAPLTVQFTDHSKVTSGSAITTWKWDFGDSHTSNIQSPSHTYNSAGVYTATLIVSNKIGSSQPKSTTITVTAALEAPVADFSASTTSGYAPLVVSFRDMSSGSPTSWLWDFGDGGTSKLQNPSHTYNIAGTYTVRLTSTNNGGSSSFSSTINVASTPSEIIANFNSNVSSGKAPLTVRFNDVSTGNPNKWNWNFGDGGTSTEQNPTHTYISSGTYAVILVVGSDTSWNTVTKYITVGDKLKAEFAASPSQGEAPLTVQFTDTSAGAPTAWLWDFGDGNTSTLQSPAYIYTRAGNYTVRLTVSNNIDSNTSEIPSLIKVSSTQIPVANFNSNSTSGNAPLSVLFSDLSTGNPTAWEWDFNSDGKVDSNEKNPVYEFMYAGNYTVTLRTGNSAGWSNNTTRTDYIIVGAGFQSSFIASPMQGSAPLSVQFTDTSTGNVTSWYWDFGDGTNSTDKNPIHSYSETGNYSVTLNVSNMDKYSVLTKQNYITVAEDSGSSDGSSSSSGSGSLAGTAGSPEPASNIYVKVQTQKFISAGIHTTFEFPKNATSIDFVEFDAKKSLGKTTTTVEQLKEKSVLTPTDPSGKIYKYINIWVGNNGIAVPENIANATISFILSKADVKIDETNESVILQRYDQGKWNQLDTIKTGEDEQFIYYQAKTPGFSSFVITSEKKITSNSEINKSLENNVSKSVAANLSQSKVPYNNDLLVQGKQSGKSEAASNIDWHQYSGIIRFLVLFILVLFIGLAIRERRK